MGSYKMLNGFDVKIDKEVYSDGEFNNDQTKAFQLNITFRANGSHKEVMECYLLETESNDELYDICDSISGDVESACFYAEKYLENAKTVFINNNQTGERIESEPQFDGIYYMLLPMAIELEFGCRPDVIVSYMHKNTWDEMSQLLECVGYQKIKNDGLLDDFILTVLVNEKK